MNLQELESRLQSLIEVDLLSLLPGRKVEDVIVQKLAAAIQLNTTKLEDGSMVAPNVYTLVMHPDKSAKWQDQSIACNLIAFHHHSDTGSRISDYNTTNN